MAAPALEPPISHAVLVPCPIGDDTPRGWAVIYANGDLAAARAVAEDWALAHLGQAPVIMAYSDHCTAAPVASWARP